MNEANEPAPVPPTPARRPLKSRSTGWARWLTRVLVRTNVTPNAISVVSILFALIGAYVLIYVPSALALLGVALCVQLRLLCNLLDGMVAIEGGKQSAVGTLYNEIPDRIADSLFIVALGFAAHALWLGWLGALAAAVTAYIRVLGGSLGLPQDFRGPMAKPHRMATMTIACLIGSIEWWWRGTQWSLLLAITAIAVGSIATCGARAKAIAAQLRAHK